MPQRNLADEPGTKEEFSSSTSSGGRGVNKLWFAICLVLVILVLWGGYHVTHRAGNDASQSSASGAKYTCGMHPTIISDKPGLCPICNMELTKIEPVATPQGTSAVGQSPPVKNELEDLFDDAPTAQVRSSSGERKLLFYRNPMNPMIISPTPAKDEMGMEYIPVYADEVDPSTPHAQSPVPAVIDDLATIRVGEEALRLTGVQTAIVKQEQEIKRTVRTVGIVVPDETRVRHVHTKMAGWIETLYVNFTGQNVEAGQPLLSIYSQELLSTQEEFLAARKTVEKFDVSGSKEIKGLGQDLLKSAKRRLELFDVPQSFIAELEKTGQVQRSVILNAPVSGFVTSKGIVEGQQVEPGLELFTITDLSHVWIEADLYEYEAGAVKDGQEAALTLSYEPGAEFKGTVSYVAPYLSPESRTLKVRFDFPNPDLKLKPQMYADVTLTLDQAAGVTIPDSALIDTGVRQVVFVETTPGSFEPRAVRTGVRGNGKAQVLAGVREGERVVVKANFLLDSESRLRAALNKMTSGAGQ